MHARPGPRRAWLAAIRPWALALSALCLASGPAQGSSTPLVRILTPRHLSTAIGSTAIELALSIPVEAEVERVEILVDGETVDRLSSPPWRGEWDAGDGTRGHRVEAVVHLSNGEIGRAVVHTSPLRINAVERVDLVNLYPVVRDGDGQYVADLQASDFRILEDGVLQTIERFTAERKPLTIAIVLDTSMTMQYHRKTRLDPARSSALTLLGALEPGDEGMVVTFSDEVVVAQSLTPDISSLAAAIESVETGGGTALYDAIWRTSRLLEQFDGRRVLVLLTDGIDESSSGLEPGSLHTVSEALAQALRSEVMVFSVGLGRHLNRTYPDPWKRRADGAASESLAQLLHRISVSTGGRAFISSGTGKLRRAFREIAADLRHQYSIAYDSMNEATDGRWREVRLLTPGRELEVVCKSGYFAADSGTAGNSRTRP